MLVSELKQFLGVLHHLNGGGAELTGTHLDIGRVQAVGLPDLAEIIRLGLAALRDDQDAVIAGASRQLAFKLLTLALFRGIVARHQ